MSRKVNYQQLPKSDLDFISKNFPNGLVAVDLETTGLSPLTDKIIEIAAIKIQNNKIEMFHELINPEIEIPDFTIKIHGITTEDVKDKPIISDVLPKFLEFTQGCDYVAHNALFDIGFLAKEISFNKLAFDKSNVFDSCKIARYVFKILEKNNNDENFNKPENYRLSTLCDFFNIPLTHHQATDDAFASLKIFSTSLNISMEKEIEGALEKSRLFKLDFFTKFRPQELSKEARELLAIIDQRKSEPTYIIYNGGTLADYPRKIRPIGLMPWPKGPVLYAECLESRMNKSFIVKKIAKVLTHDQFEEKYGTDKK